MNFKNVSLKFFIGLLSLVLFAFSAMASYLVLDVAQFDPYQVRSRFAEPGSLPKAFIVQSGSMEPAVKTGSIVITRKAETYNQGEIISYKKDAKNVITHRIQVKNYPDGINSDPVYLTAGDANEDFDSGSITNDQIVGKVALTLPYLGYVANFAKQPYGFLLLVIVPATIVIYEELKGLLKEIFKTLSILKRKLFNRKGRTLKYGLQGTTLKAKNGGLHKATAIVPIFGAALVFTALASSFFSDKETSQGNVFQASTWGSPTPTPTVQPGDIVINEVYYDVDADHVQPPGSDENTFEWVEIYNKSAQTVNLKDWKIEDNSGTQRTISTSNRNLASGQFAILAKAANVFVLWTIPDSAEKIQLGEIIGNGLANGGDRVVLRDSLGNIIDQMSYGTDVSVLNPSSSDVAEGHSLERVPDGFDNDLGSDFFDTNPPTPGS